MMYWYGNGMNGWGYALMTVSMVLFWGLVIFGVVVLIRYLARASQRPQDTTAPRPTPEQLLAERFARGPAPGGRHRRAARPTHAAGLPDRRAGRAVGLPASPVPGVFLPARAPPRDPGRAGAGDVCPCDDRVHRTRRRAPAPQVGSA